VYLGNFSLIRTYFLDVGVRIVYMLLMSWAGEQVNKDLILAMGRDLDVDTNRAVTKMLDCGVEHRDLRPPNVLRNSETRNLVLIDFERSEILQRKLVLQELSPNWKRKDSQSCIQGKVDYAEHRTQRKDRACDHTFQGVSAIKNSQEYIVVMLEGLIAVQGIVGGLEVSYWYGFITTLPKYAMEQSSSSQCLLVFYSD
jgi:serine/threonine protein kinase